MNDVVGFDIHRGALAAAVRPPADDASALLTTSRTVAIGEDLNDHENLGAIARSAVALGVDALLLSPGSADPLYRRSVRVSMGEMLHLPYAVLEPWPASLTEVVAAAGFRMIAMTPSGELAIEDVQIGPDERIAVLLGAEGPGLSAAAMQAAHHRVRITIRPGVDSLNVGHAAAIAFHRFGRASTAANPRGGGR
jgi:tRNA G18 (ribose-2'-O)-methylase SpoU